jgi:signal transduction histidine kinase
VLRLTDFPVGELLGALRGMVRPLVSSDAVALVMELPEPGWIMRSDEGKVSQVLRNLVSNAVKFTPAGEIRVEARLVAAGESVEFTVTDTGIGIAGDDLERIFEEYAQVENYLQRRATGTGLGLPLSRKLAALLGGSLTVASEPGRGSTFTFRVPRVCHADEEHPEPVESVTEGAGTGGHHG